MKRSGSHPGGISRRAAMWFGQEVEGRARRGLFTAFVRRALTKEQMARVMRPRVTHIFLTEEFFDLGWVDATLWPLVTQKGKLLTVGRNLVDVSEFLIWRRGRSIHLSVLIHEQAVLGIGTDDEIRIGRPYDLLTFSAHQGIRTLPADYEEDVK